MRFPRFVVKIEKQNFSFWILCGVVTSGVFFRLFGLLYPARGAKLMSQFFGSSFFGN